MKKEGHIVGNHTVHHKSMPTLSDRDNKQEIIDCAQYCKEATGYDMDPFIRPPMGEYNERTLALTKRWDIGQFSGVWLTWILRWINSLEKTM